MALWRIQRALITGLVVLWLVGSVRAEQAPEADPCDGLVVLNLQVEGCEGGVCGEPEIRDAVLGVARDAMGDRYTKAHLAAARERLAALDFFSTVDARCSVRDGGADVQFRGQPNGIIKELVILGNDHFYVGEVRKRVFLRQGTLLAAGSKAGNEQIRRQEETLKNRYERAGLVGTEVEVRTEDLGHGELRVVVDIDEGNIQRIDRVDIEFHLLRDGELKLQPGWKDPGWVCPSFTEAQLMRASGLDELEIYTTRAEKDVRRRLRERLQAWGIEDPRILVSYDPEKGRVDVQVTYRGCYLIQFKERSVRQGDEKGYQSVERAAWRSLLPFGQSGNFDFEEAEYGRRLLLADMENSGRLFAEVTLDYRRLDPRSAEPGEVLLVSDVVRGIITYYITTGPVVEIRSIRFPGMSFFDSDEVLERMSTKVYDFFGDGGYLQDEQLFGDLAVLKRMYQDEGFFRVRVGAVSDEGLFGRSRRIEKKQEIFSYVAGDLGFQMTKPLGQNVAYIEALIDEGIRSRVGQMTLEGCEERRCVGAAEASGMKEGSPFSRMYLKKAIKGITSYYQEAGYPNIDVQVRCVARGPEETVDRCDPIKVTSEEVDLLFQITPGSHVRVGSIFLLGNFHTDDDAILRDLPTTGDILVMRKVREGERRLRNLGIFNSVRVSIVGLGQAGDVAVLPLVVKVEESPAQFLDFAVGFESINRVSSDTNDESGKMPPEFSSTVSNSVKVSDRPATFLGNLVPFDIPDLLFVFQMEYINKNLAGNAQEFRFPFKYGLSTTDPMRLVALAPTLIDRRLFGSDVHLRQTIYGLFDKARNPFDLLEGGLETEVSQSFGEHLFLSGQYNINTSAIRQLDVDEPKFDVPSILNKLSLRIGWQNLDQLTHPSGGFGVFGDGNYINSITLDDGDASNFFKYEISGKLFFNIKKVIVFANLARLGGSYSFEGQSLPEIERFRLGGSKGLRGFEDSEVGQYLKDGSLIDGDPSTEEIDRVNAGDFILAGTHEIRFPLMFNLGPVEFWGAGFFDWGALADSYGAFYKSSFRTTAGFGLRLLLYGAVPIRLDYGLKLERRCKVPGTEDGVCLEQESPGELDFNLLYTF